MKTNRGISLIVLVITIIVMIVLAGTIILSLNNSGIIDKASEAVEETNLKQLKHDLTTTLLMQGWYEGKEVTSNTFGEYLEKIPEVTRVTKLTEGTWKVERQGTVITVYQSGEVIDGTINIWDGTTIKAPKIDEGSWYIYNGEELKFLEQFVNNGGTLTDVQKVKVQEAGYLESDYVITETTQVHLMADIDLGARQKNGELITEPETQWKPIGENGKLKFIGIFEGNDHYITGVYVNESGNYCGIFGCAVGINDLTIKNSYIAGKSAVGGIVGVAEKITNCHNIDTQVKGIQEDSNYVGGIVGVANESSEIKTCSNTGSITGEGKHAGGIVGAVGKSSRVSACDNKGAVTGYDDYVGGIAGSASPSSQINGCINHGNVFGELEYVAGICGLFSTDSNDPSEAQPSKVTYCINTGNIVGKYLNTGGIVGCLAQYGSIAERCYNIGMVSGNEKVGGILGEMGRSSKLINCYNIANVKGNELIGGLLGRTYYSAGTIENSYNIGKITGSSRVGGIIGNNESGSKIINSYYLQGTATVDDGSGTATDLMKTAEYIKTTFLTNANATETIWEIRQGKNNGYPMIIGLE